MDLRLLRLPVLALVGMLVVAACSPAASPAPAVDVVGSEAAQMAAAMQTQTAAADSPTPPPVTPSPVPTAAPTLTPTASAPGDTITVINHPGCYFGPGPTYPLESFINTPKKVQLLGVGSVSGWYVIRNPYFHAPCWVAAANVQIPAGMNVSSFPTMTPNR